MKHIINFFKQTNKFIDEEKKQLAYSNIKLIKIMAPLYFSYLLLLIITNLFYLRNFSISKCLIIAFLIHTIFTAIIYFYYWFYSPTYNTVSAICLSFGCMIMSLAIIMGVFYNKSQFSVVFPIMLILMSQIYTLKLKNILLLLTTSFTVYSILIFIYKPHFIAFYDLIIAIVALSISVISVITIMHYKVTEYTSRKMYERLSKTDPLTGILNKSAFKKKYADHIKLTDRFALLIFDIDNFKSINDKYGHTFGDSILLEFSSLLFELFATLNRKNIIGRFGGDEFVIIIREPKDYNTLKDDVFKKIYQISDTIFQKLNVTITCSVGIALCDGIDNTYEQVFARADKALFKAKKNGKNRCYIEV